MNEQGKTAPADIRTSWADVWHYVREDRKHMLRFVAIALTFLLSTGIVISAAVLAFI